jgi:hypothetical protein
MGGFLHAGSPRSGKRIAKIDIMDAPVNLNRKLSEIAEVEFSDVAEFAEDSE